MFAVIHSDVVSWREHPTARVFTRPHHRPLTISRWCDHDEDAYAALLHGRRTYYKRPGAHILVGVGRTRVAAVLSAHGFLRFDLPSKQPVVPTHEGSRRNAPSHSSISMSFLREKRVHLSSASGEGAQIAAHLSEAGVGTVVTSDGHVVSASDIGPARYRREELGSPRLDALQRLLTESGTIVCAGGASDADLSIAMTEQSPGTAWMEAHYEDVPYLLYHLRAASAVLAGVFQRGHRVPRRCPACDGATPRELSPRRSGHSPASALGAAMTAARAVEFLLSPTVVGQQTTISATGLPHVDGDKNTVWCMC